MPYASLADQRARYHQRKDEINAGRRRRYWAKHGPQVIARLKEHPRCVMCPNPITSRYRLRRKSVVCSAACRIKLDNQLLRPRVYAPPRPCEAGCGAIVEGRRGTRFCGYPCRRRSWEERNGRTR